MRRHERGHEIELWIPITIAAAFLQNLRSMLQKHLKGRLSTGGATYARFIYALPFALLYVAGLAAAPGFTLPAPHATFALYTVTGGLAQIVGGHLADKYPLKNVYLASYILLAPVLFIAAGTEELPLLVAASVVVFINVGSLPAENTLMARYTPGKWRNTVFGAKFVLTLGVSALGVPLVAFIYGLGQGFYALFVALSALAVIVIAAAVFLPSEPKVVPAPRPSGSETPAE